MGRTILLVVDTADVVINCPRSKVNIPIFSLFVLSSLPCPEFRTNLVLSLSAPVVHQGVIIPALAGEKRSSSMGHTILLVADTADIVMNCWRSKLNIRIFALFEES